MVSSTNFALNWSKIAQFQNWIYILKIYTEWAVEKFTTIAYRASWGLRNWRSKSGTLFGWHPVYHIRWRMFGKFSVMCLEGVRSDFSKFSLCSCEPFYALSLMENVLDKFLVDVSHMPEICNQISYVLYPDRYII